jgi:hypothetical protein
VIKLKLDSKLQGTATISLQELASHLYHNPGARMVGIVEIAHTERTEPAQGEDKDPAVTIGLKAIEMARGDQDEFLRRAMEALHRHRTSTGTLDEEMQPKLSQSTLDRLAGLDAALEAAEAARLRVVVEQTADYIDRVKMGKLTAPQAREELETVRKMLSGSIYWGQP